MTICLFFISSPCSAASYIIEAEVQWGQKKLRHVMRENLIPAIPGGRGQAKAPLAPGASEKPLDLSDQRRLLPLLLKNREVSVFQKKHLSRFIRVSCSGCARSCYRRCNNQLYRRRSNSRY